MIDLNKLREVLKNTSREELEKFFLFDNIPKGWVSIEDYRPQYLAKDLLQGYSTYMVKDKNGNEFQSEVTDPNVWYYQAKNIGITHFYNE